MSFDIKEASMEDRKRFFEVFVTLEKMSDSHQSAIHKFIQWYLNETRGPFTFLVKSTWDEQWHWMKITVLYGKAVIIKLKSFGKPEHSEYPTEEAFNKTINCLIEIEDAIKEQLGDDKISAPTWARESIEEFGSGPSWNDTFNGQFKVREENDDGNSIANTQSQPHGYWVPTDNGCMCSECYAEIDELDAMLSYECPNCHALMGEQDYKFKEEE